MPPTRSGWRPRTSRDAPPAADRRGRARRRCTAVVALGIGLVFGIMRLINLAYGELITAGGYTLAILSGQSAVVAILACVAVVVALSLVMERVAFRPLRGASPATMLVATFAISFLLQNVYLLKFGSRGRTVGTLGGPEQRDQDRVAATSAGSRSSPCSSGSVLLAATDAASQQDDDRAADARRRGRLPHRPDPRRAGEPRDQLLVRGLGRRSRPPSPCCSPSRTRSSLPTTASRSRSSR